MSQTSMSFSRQNSYTTQEYGDSIKYNVSSSPDFGRGNKATRAKFNVSGLTNGTRSGATRDIVIQIETSDGVEYNICSTSIYLSGSGTSGASVSIDWFDIPTAYQYEIANKTISAIYVLQDSDYSIRGVSGSGTLTFEYESAATRCTAPSAVSIASNVAGDATTLSWSGAKAGSYNAITSYYVEYADSSDGVSWADWNHYYTLETSATYGSISVALPGTGNYRKFRIWTFGELINSETATESSACYHAYTPSAPGSLSPAAGGYTSLSAISWGAVSCIDPIQSYSYQISTDGGASWGAETTTTATSVNISSWFNSIGASSRVLFRVRAYTNKGISSGWSTSGTFYRKVPPQAPTAFSASPASFGGGNITLQWSGASDPEGNIAGYEIEVATSSNGSTWTDYSFLKTIQSTAASGSATDTPNMADGTYRRYRIRTKDGDGLYSGYRESNSVYRLQSPTMPEIVSPSAGYYQTAPIVSWKASTAPDGNLAGYSGSISIDGGATWSPEYTTTATRFDISPVFDAAPLTAAFVVRVRAYTTGGTYSNYATSATFYRNTPVVAPKLLSPHTQAVKAGRIWAFVQCAAKDNGLAQTLYYQSPSGERTTLASGKTEAFSIAYPLTASGSHAFILMDSTGANAETDVSVSLVKTKYTDTTIEAGTTPTRAAHIAEPRADVDSILAAYGMQDAGWSETVEAGTTSLRHFNSHILEIRRKIEAIRKKVNDFAGETKISAFSWCELSDAGPKADAIKELRAAISKL
jgi:hypothetical protein